MTSLAEIMEEFNDESEQEVYYVYRDWMKNRHDTGRDINTVFFILLLAMLVE